MEDGHPLSASSSDFNTLYEVHALLAAGGKWLHAAAQGRSMHHAFLPSKNVPAIGIAADRTAVSKPHHEKNTR